MSGPLSDDDLAAKVVALSDELGRWPSQREVMRALSVGRPRAATVLEVVRASGFAPAAVLVEAHPGRRPAGPGEPAPAAPPQTHQVLGGPLDDAAVTAPIPVRVAPRTRADAPDEPPPGGDSGAPDELRAEPGPTESRPAGRDADAGRDAARVRRDWVTDLGVLTVGAAAAILTFTTLTDLAVSVGISGAVLGWLQLQWLLPVTIDAAGVVAARVWLRGLGDRDAVRFARLLALACIALSVVANAGQHVLEALHIAPAWWVVVAVTSVPPAMLGAVVHLGHLMHRHEHG